MKFILMIEEDGYQIRYWDQINEEIGDSIASNWDIDKLFEKLKNQNFHISLNVLKEAVERLDRGPEPFVVLKSESLSIVNLDSFINDLFVIDKEV